MIILPLSFTQVFIQVKQKLGVGGGGGGGVGFWPEKNMDRFTPPPSPRISHEEVTEFRSKTLQNF